MGHKDLLKAVADYGHGVFSVTMLEDEKARNALNVFLHRNPAYFSSFHGRRGDVTIRSLSNEGLKYFGGADRLSTSESWQSYLDMLLFNSYMMENKSWRKYSNKPHSVLEVDGKKIGVVSLRWGINVAVANLDILVCIPQIKENILSKRDEFSHIHEKLFVPKSVMHLRPTVI